MKKIIFLLALFISLVLTGKVLAFPQDPSVTMTILIRGKENWKLKKQQPLDLPLFYYQQVDHLGIPTTYMLRYDAIKDDKISSQLKALVATDSAQFLGGLLEVTPKLAQAANAQYQNHGSFTSANHLFLSGYDRKDRLKIIDTFMELFFQKFGNYPAVVGVDSLDSFSFDYLVSHYSVVSAFISDETFSGNNLRQWGGYLSSAYLPSKQNILIPAQGSKNRINGVIFKWSPADPASFRQRNSPLRFNVVKSPYISNASSYKSLRENTHLNIRLDNNYKLIFQGKDKAEKNKNARQSIFNIFSQLKIYQDKQSLNFQSAVELGELTKARYPQTPSASFFKLGDLYWYQNPFYRLVLRSLAGKAEIIDFKVYNSQLAGNYFDVKNIDTTAFQEIPSSIDFFKYPHSSIPIDFNLKTAKISSKYWNLILEDQEKTIKLGSRKIIFQNIPLPPQGPDQVKIKTAKKQTIWKISPNLPFNYLKNDSNLILKIALAFIIIFLILKNFSRKPVRLILLGLLTASITLIPLIFSGQIYSFGLGFWGPNGHDAIFHLSLINSFKHSLFSLSHPQIAGLKLQNYHLGVDWLTAFISRFTGINSVSLFFRWLPVILAGLIVSQLLKLLSCWKYSPLASKLALFLAFLTGSFGFIFTMFNSADFFSGESLFWMNQSVSLFLNPPFAFSLALLLLFFNLYSEKDRTLTRVPSFFLVLIGGLLAQTKIYAFILLLLSLLIIKEVKLVLAIALVGLVLLLPSLGLNGSPFVFSPLWFPKSLIAAQDKLNWQKLVQAWQVYEADGVYLKLIMVNFLALGIYLLGNLGIRTIGLLNLLKGLLTKDGSEKISPRTALPFKWSHSYADSSEVRSVVLAESIIILGLIIPLLFIQANNPWNTIQFSYYSLFFLSIFTAKELAAWFKRLANKKLLLYLAWLLFFSLTLPTTIGTLKDYTTHYSASRISLTEMQALTKLKNQEKGIVVSPLFNKSTAREVPAPKPLYAYTYTAYISAFSAQPEYLSDLINLDITGFNYKERAKNVQRLFRTSDAPWVKSFLTQEKIKYIYQTPQRKLQIEPQSACLSPIFLSGEIVIYKFTCDQKANVNISSL